MRTFTTGEVAEQAGVNVQTVRYYERRGLLPEPPRLGSGYRQFRPEDVSRIRFIKRAQELGFTLREIEELLDLRAEPGATSGQVKRATEEKIVEVEAKIRDLQRIRDTLAHLAEACDGHGTTQECPILEALESAS